jgi:hypothetical protein
MVGSVQQDIVTRKDQEGSISEGETDQSSEVNHCGARKYQEARQIRPQQLTTARPRRIRKRNRSGLSS